MIIIVQYSKLCLNSCISVLYPGRPFIRKCSSTYFGIVRALFHCSKN